LGDASSDHNPLDLIDAEFVTPVIVKPGGARRGMVRHRCGLLKRAEKIGGDPSR